MQTKRCKECKKKKRLTLFTLKKDAIDFDDPIDKRLDVCRACNYDGLTADQRHLILREAFRNYLTWGDLIAYGDGKTMHVSDTLTYNVPKERGSEELISITVSFHDLARALNQFTENKQGTVLSKRKEQAFYLNVIRDMKQKDVAKLMNITTVSVGQYVDQAMLQLSDYYFSDSHQQTEQDIELMLQTHRATTHAFGTLDFKGEQDSNA